MKQKIRVVCAAREDGVFRALMQEMDDGERYTFCIVRNGTQALRAVREVRTDILVMDAVLSGLDGPALVDRLRREMGAGMPHVIGGAMMPFAGDVLKRHGIERVVSVPWQYEELRKALLELSEETRSQIDWERAAAGFAHARSLLERLGMHASLYGCRYLSWAAALIAQDESRQYAIGERVYAPIAQKESTTPQNVERLIRHAVESTMDSAKAEALYAFFGNTIDPARGKPTNAQMIAMLAQKVRVGRK